MGFTGTDQNRHFSLLLFKIWPHLCASSFSASCHSQAWALFQVFLKSLGTSLTPRVLPCSRIFFFFFHQGLGLLLEAPIFPFARGWLVIGVESGNQSIGSNLCSWAELGHSHFTWHLGTRKPKHSCPYTQSCSGAHGIVKNTWKHKFTAFCQNSESSHWQSPWNCSALTVLAESLSHNIQKDCLHQNPSVHNWGVPSIPTQGRQFMASTSGMLLRGAWLWRSWQHN